MSLAVAPPRRSPMAPAGVRLAIERAEDRAAVDALIDRAFGPGRFAKAAERLRERLAPHPGLSVCAWSVSDAGVGDGDELVGVVRQWPICIGETPAVFFGPIAVTGGFRHRGVASVLTRRAAEAARAADERLALLVGEPGLFLPLGYEVAPAGRVVLPGPVDPARVMWRALAPGALEGVGGEAGPRRDGHRPTGPRVKGDVASRRVAAFRSPWTG